MRRVQAACLYQTIHFELKEGVSAQEAQQTLQNEIEHYKAQLVRRRVAHRLCGQQTLPDGSVLLWIKRQYNHHAIGDFLSE